MDKVLTSEVEHELVVTYQNIRKLIGSSQPLNEEVRENNYRLVMSYKEVEKVLSKSHGNTLKIERDIKNKEDLKFIAQHKINCLHCEAAIQVKPSGEVKLEDYLLYFTFQCPKCGKDFTAEKPNNDNDLLIYYKNLLEDIQNVGQIVTRFGKEKTYKEGEVRNLKKLYAALRQKVNKTNDLNINVSVSTQNLNDVLLQSIDNMTVIRKELDKGVNIFGLKPNKTEGPMKKQLVLEKELQQLLDSTKVSGDKFKAVGYFVTRKKNKFLKKIEKAHNKLNKCIQKRDDQDLLDEADNHLLWNELIQSVCPTCQTKWVILPHAEMRCVNDLVHFFYYCKHCKAAYASSMPNNYPDEEKHYKTVLKTLVVVPEIDAENRQLFQMTKEEMRFVKKGYRNVKRFNWLNRRIEKGVRRSKEIHNQWVLAMVKKLRIIDQKMGAGENFFGIL